MKWRSAQTGRQEIQALVGARQLNHATALFFFTASGYSPKAIEYASVMNIALFTFDVRGELTAVSPAARTALRRPHPAPQSTSHVTAPKPPSRAERIWNTVWLATLSALGWFYALVTLIVKFTDPDSDWAHVAFFWVFALALTALWWFYADRGFAVPWRTGAKPR